jgi:Family of unknown function (DUF5996)
MPSEQAVLPALPLDEWEATKTQLHLFLQIVGKIRLAVMPRRNHWWNITLYLSPTGLTTGPMPYRDGFESFEIALDFVEHSARVLTSERSDAGTAVIHSIPLGDGMSVAEFRRRLFEALAAHGIEPSIIDRPYDLPTTLPFSQITDAPPYQGEYVERFWRILLWVDGVFKEFSGRFYGKTCPVHLYWHHMDLAVTRFSGRRGPALPKDRSIADKDAYSHEVISFGFWAGDETVRAPAFYSYAYPSPDGLDAEPLAPEAAAWSDAGGSPMAMLMYDDLRTDANPRTALLDFLESAYRAGASRASWDIEDLVVPPLRDL